MLVVTVDLVPAGRESQRRTIGSLRIANISNLAPVSDYSVDVWEAANPLAGNRARMASCRVEGHARNRSVWALIGQAVAALETAEFVDLQPTRTTGDFS